MRIKETSGFIDVGTHLVTIHDANETYEEESPIAISTAVNPKPITSEVIQAMQNKHDLPQNINNAAKNDQDKIDLSLIPLISNIEHAKAFMVGEKKYGRYNYCKGHKASQLVAAASRHLQAWFNGEELDPKDGQHHLGSVMACCSMLLRQKELGTLKDDRYNENNKE
jgi:hypothetical protein